jgi:hypothetical protein
MTEKNYAFIVVVNEVSEPVKRVSVKLFNTAEEGVLLAEDTAPNYSGNGLQRAVRRAFDQLEGKAILVKGRQVKSE